jgi:multicomponent Na+:H+ antiporter subunit F
MPDFLLAAAVLVLGTVALGLMRCLRGPGDADRMLAAQLLGTGGVAALLLIGTATGTRGVADVALVLALLAAFASVAFANGVQRREPDPGPSDLPTPGSENPLTETRRHGEENAD